MRTAGSLSLLKRIVGYELNGTPREHTILTRIGARRDSSEASTADVLTTFGAGGVFPFAVLARLASRRGTGIYAFTRKFAAWAK